MKKESGVIEGSMPHKQTNELMGRTREEKKAGETVNELLAHRYNRASFSLRRTDWPSLSHCCQGHCKTK